jgi:predicted hotdog family 3-hydroxylacyl-ACP dehydratase
MIDIDVAELLQHDGNMMLLDKVIEFDHHSMVAEAMVRSDGMFDDGNTVPAWLGIEYMAQTIAAHDGMMCKLAGKPNNMGFLLGTRRYLCNVDTLTIGLILTVSVKRLMEDQGLAVFDCLILANSVEISAKINVYQPNSSINKVIEQ